MNYIKMYLIALLMFVLVDAVWLTVSRGLYQKEIGHLLSTSFKLLPAVIFYLLFLVGLVYFVINPAINSGDIKTLIFSALLFGLVTYATYDLTNLATMKDWPVKITIIDLIWGSSLSTIISLATYYIYNLFK